MNIFNNNRAFVLPTKCGLHLCKLNNKHNDKIFPGCGHFHSENGFTTIPFFITSFFIWMPLLTAIWCSNQLQRSAALSSGSNDTRRYKPCLKRTHIAIIICRATMGFVFGLACGCQKRRNKSNFLARIHFEQANESELVH